MSKRRFSSDQIKELLCNINVVQCSDKSITYSKEFKIRAIKQCLDQGLPAKTIFAKAGFDLQIIGIKTPKTCLTNWRRTVRMRGLKALNVKGQGKKPGSGRPRTKGLTDVEKIKRLETENAYLKAENNFLVKLRAQRKS